MAQAVQSSPVLTETDSLRISGLFAMWWGLRSPDLMSAYTSVAENASAGVPLRVLTINALGKLSRTSVEFFGPTDPSALACSVGADYISDSTNVGSPLPAGYKTSIYNTMKAIEADLSGPVAVRGVAHCWRVWLGRYEPLDISTITLSYVCGTTFRIANPNANGYVFTFQSVGANVLTSQNGVIKAAGFGNTDFSMIYPGTLRLFYKGTLIQTKPNGGTACH
jgi:hypothetical protein